MKNMTSRVTGPKRNNVISLREFFGAKLSKFQNNEEAMCAWLNTCVILLE